MKRMGEANNRVFLTASSNVRTGAVKDMLRQVGLHPIDWEGIPPGPLGQALRKLFSQCAALIAVVTEEPSPSPGLLVEVGAAIGSGLPVILIVTSPEARTKLPAVLRELPMINLGADRRATGDRIVQTIAAYSELQADPQLTTRSPARRWDSEVERRVADILEHIGIRVVGQYPANNKNRVDLAAWLPDIGAQLNPILVEVTGRLADLRQRREALRQYLRDAQTFIGILVTVEPHEPVWEFLENTAIVTLGVDFLENIDFDHLVSLLTDGRNQLIHQP